MSWASSLQREAVSFLDMSESGIPLNVNQSHSYTNECVTKLALRTKYKVKLENLVSYAEDELVMKKDIFKVTDPILSYTYSVAKQSDNSHAECGKNPGSYITVYSPDNYADGILRVGITLFDDASLKFRFLGGFTTWYTIDSTIALIDRDGVVLSISTCQNNFVLYPFYRTHPCVAPNVYKNTVTGKYHTGPGDAYPYISGLVYSYLGPNPQLGGRGHEWNMYGTQGDGEEPEFVIVTQSTCAGDD